MRWRPLSDRNIPKAANVAGCIVLLPIFGPPLALLLALCWLHGRKRELMGPSQRWRPWFAWYPVTVLSDDWLESRAVWLEWIERQQIGQSVYYRNLPIQQTLS